MRRFDNLAEAVEASSGEREVLVAAGIRFHYRVASAYATARRLLDRLVVVANELLPRTGTDLGNSHAGFGPRLARRCGDLGVALPDGLLAEIDDLNARIKTVRDELEHPGSPMSMRGITIGEKATAETWKVVPVCDDPMKVQFEPAGELREALHAHVNVMVNLLETASRRPNA